MAKRKAIISENLTNKKNRHESDLLGLDERSENTSMIADKQIKGDSGTFSKYHLIKELEAVKKITKCALSKKIEMCAKLKQEKETLEVKMCLLEDKNKTLEYEKVELTRERKRKEGKRDDKNQIVEQLVENLQGKVENQSNEVQMLIREIESLEGNVSYLKNTLESMEADKKLANKQLVEKDQEISNLKEVGSEEVVFYKQTIEALEINVATLEMENEIFNNSVLKKDIELGNITKCARILQIDLNEKVQEISDLESINRAIEEKICLLSNAKTKSDKMIFELEKKRNIELDNIFRKELDRHQKNLEEMPEFFKNLEATEESLKNYDPTIIVIENLNRNLKVSEVLELGTVAEYWFERPKSMCWVRYQTKQQAYESKKVLDGKFWCGAKLKVSFSSLKELKKVKKDVKSNISEQKDSFERECLDNEINLGDTFYPNNTARTFQDIGYYSVNNPAQLRNSNANMQQNQFYQTFQYSFHQTWK